MMTLGEVALLMRIETADERPMTCPYCGCGPFTSSTNFSLHRAGCSKRRQVTP